MPTCPECSYTDAGTNEWFQKVGWSGWTHLIVCPQCDAVLGGSQGF